jgi:hypothetical protein
MRSLSQLFPLSPHTHPDTPIPYRDLEVMSGYWQKMSGYVRQCPVVPFKLLICTEISFGHPMSGDVRLCPEECPIECPMRTSNVRMHAPLKRVRSGYSTAYSMCGIKSLSAHETSRRAASSDIPRHVSTIGHQLVATSRVRSRPIAASFRLRAAPCPHEVPSLVLPLANMRRACVCHSCQSAAAHASAPTPLHVIGHGDPPRLGRSPVACSSIGTLPYPLFPSAGSGRPLSP